MLRGHLNKKLRHEATRGLSEYLNSQISYTDIIKTKDVNGLSVITRGVVPPNPSEMLMNDRL